MLSLVLKLVKRSVFGSGDDLDFATLISYFVLGAGGGIFLYFIFSLLGYGIYAALKLFKF